MFRVQHLLVLTAKFIKLYFYFIHNKIDEVRNNLVIKAYYTNKLNLVKKA